ncbi:MAG: zinc-binding dehydrogenase [Erysipelotrichaceae bacterium]|nr:zinc-binding dehydrogenase [Erysipelotrichaceae bacterium]
MDKINHVIALTAIGKVEIEEHPMFTCDPDKMIIKTDYCALCTYEQRVFSGVHKIDLPLIGGHEVSGTVVEVGKELQGKDFKVGDKVVVGVNISCGTCYYCQTGQSQSCPNFSNLIVQPGAPYPGTAALMEYQMQKAQNVFKYYDVTPQEACLIEPISCVLHSVESADPQFGYYAVIIGAGMMGQLHSQLARLKGCMTIVIDMNTERLKLASQLGATHVIDPTAEDALAKVMEYTHGRGADIVFDTTPAAEVAQDAMKYLAYCGKLVIYSGIYPNKKIEVDPHLIHKRSYQIIGSANSSQRDFVRSSSLLSHRLIEVRPFIEGVFEAKDAQKAFETAPGRFRNLIHLHF